MGTRNFNIAFTKLATDVLGADQCMIFAYGADTAQCFLSFSNQSSGAGQLLAEAYILEGHEADPIRPRIDARRAVEGVDILPLSGLWAEMDASYRRRFFTAPGLVDKMAVLACGRGLMLALNFYRGHGSGPYDNPISADLAALFHATAQMALLHYSTSEDGSLKDPLLTLSERERETCNWILKGLSTEAIAHQMEVSPNTITTYRKRAYEKLSINSKAALFALCN